MRGRAWGFSFLIQSLKLVKSQCAIIWKGGGGSPIFSKGVLVYDTQFKTGEIPKTIFLVSCQGDSSFFIRTPKMVKFHI